MGYCQVLPWIKYSRRPDNRGGGNFLVLACRDQELCRSVGGPLLQDWVVVVLRHAERYCAWPRVLQPGPAHHSTQDFMPCFSNSIKELNALGDKARVQWLVYYNPKQPAHYESSPWRHSKVQSLHLNDRDARSSLFGGRSVGGCTRPIRGEPCLPACTYPPGITCVSSCRLSSVSHAPFTGRMHKRKEMPKPQ